MDESQCSVEVEDAVAPLPPLPHPTQPAIHPSGLAPEGRREGGGMGREVEVAEEKRGFWGFGDRWTRGEEELRVAD